MGIDEHNFLDLAVRSCLLAFIFPYDERRCKISLLEQGLG